MAYDFLKKLFASAEEGDAPRALTYEELEAAIDADKGITLVNLKDGGYVSEEKFKAKETELKGVQAQLTTANETIKGFEGQDVEGIKRKVSEWETRYNTDTQELRDKLAAQARSHAEEMFLSGYQFTSKAARNGVLAELRAKEFKLGDDGSLLGGKEFMDSLMENEDYKGAFVVEQEPEGDGGQPPEPGPRRPRFSAPTNGGVVGGEQKNPFNFSFTHVNPPKQ